MTEMTLQEEYLLALQQLEAAKQLFDHVDPSNFHAVDSAVYRIACAEKHFASIYHQINNQGGIAV